MKLVIGLVLAAVSSAMYAVSYSAQHEGAASAATLNLRRPVWSLCQLFAARQWLIGYVINLSGWGVYIAALALAPLSLVQAANAAAIGPLAVMTHRRSSGSNRLEIAASCAAMAGLIAVLATVRVNQHDTRPTTLAVMTVVLLGAGLIGALWIVAPSRTRGAVLGIGSGIWYGVGDVATKGALFGSVLLVPVFLACMLAGFISLQLAYQQTSLLKSAGMSCLFTNIVPITCGMVLFGELPSSSALLALRCIGFAVLISGAVILSVDTPVEVPEEPSLLS